MRLSDVKGERSLDVIADIIDPIANIAADEDAMTMFRPQKPKDGESATDAFTRRMRKAAPALLKGHKADVIAILAAIKGVSVKEYTEQMTLATVVGDVFELLTDEEFLSFLPSSGQTSK